MTELKVCAKCERVLSIDNFRKVKKWRVGRCRDCTKEELSIYRQRPDIKKRDYLYKKKYNDEDPLRHKANILVGGLAWGRGANIRMTALLNKYLNTKCKYCKIVLHLSNISLDHKIPVAHSLRKLSKRTPHSIRQSMSTEEFTRLNSEDNLQLICLTCNRSKGNLTDEEYTALLSFLKHYPRMEGIVKGKLKGSNFMYRNAG